MVFIQNRKPLVAVCFLWIYIGLEKQHLVNVAERNFHSLFIFRMIVHWLTSSRRFLRHQWLRLCRNCLSNRHRLTCCCSSLSYVRRILIRHSVFVDFVQRFLDSLWYIIINYNSVLIWYIQSGAEVFKCPWHPNQSRYSSIAFWLFLTFMYTLQHLFLVGVITSVLKIFSELPRRTARLLVLASC